MLSAGDILLQPSAHTVFVNGNGVELTHKEFELLRFFMVNKNQVFSRAYELPEQKVFIRADRKRIEQVLNNLIENAKKHVCEGGEIRMAVHCCDTYLQFSIFNQGAAIPLVELSKIWRKFYRGQNHGRSGSGLGLAIAAQILSMYQVSYGAEPHTEGTEFFFQFPINP